MLNDTVELEFREADSRDVGKFVLCVNHAPSVDIKTLPFEAFATGVLVDVNYHDQAKRSYVVALPASERVTTFTGCIAVGSWDFKRANDIAASAVPVEQNSTALPIANQTPAEGLYPNDPTDAPVAIKEPVNDPLDVLIGIAKKLESHRPKGVAIELARGLLPPELVSAMDRRSRDIGECIQSIVHVAEWLRSKAA